MTSQRAISVLTTSTPSRERHTSSGFSRSPHCHAVACHLRLVCCPPSSSCLSCESLQQGISGMTADGLLIGQTVHAAECCHLPEHPPQSSPVLSLPELGRGGAAMTLCVARPYSHTLCPAPTPLSSLVAPPSNSFPESLAGCL